MSVIFKCLKENKELKEKFKVLEQREIEILDLALFGMSNKEIANTMAMSESSVKLTFSDIFVKTRLKNKFRIFAFVIEALQKTIESLKSQ